MKGVDARGEWICGAGGFGALVCMAGLAVSAWPAIAWGEDWRSSLYPEDWTPEYRDEAGRFVHDFSYAGYRMGERSIPAQPPGPVADVTAPPYEADPTGERDSTEAIQRAIDDVGEQGGGVVHLPEGVYRVRPGSQRNAALRIAHDAVVLRGDGPQRTFVFNDQTEMRGKAVIRVQPNDGPASWTTPVADSEIPLATDASNQSRRVRVEPEASDALSPGDWIVLRVDATESFVEEMAGAWLVEHWAGRLPGPTFYREVVAVDHEQGAIEIDIPLRLPLKLRDGARLYRVAPHLSEVGIEGLAIGMREHPAAEGEGWGFNDYTQEGTAAWDVHASYALDVRHVVHGWIQSVHTYRPESNDTPHHTISNVLALRFTRNVTVAECDFRQAQYRGGGGNGYGYVFQGSDNLMRDCYGEQLRYVFDFKSMQSTGNVVLRGRSAGRSDFHMHLSAANLLDNLTMIDEYFYAGSRRLWGTTPHGQSTRDSVFWNTHGEGDRPRHVIDVSDQPQGVMIVGTRGERTAVRGATDATHLEGVGRGGTLQPQSLYQDQLQRRLGNGRGR